ncbi:hypothetical protein Tco_0668368 [Tanacetum coccineum]
MAHWTTYVNVSHACASCSIFLGIALAIFSSLLLLLLLSFSIFHSLALAAFIFFLAYTTTYIQRSNSCYLLWFLACFLVLLAVISCYFPTFQKHSSCYLSCPCCCMLVVTDCDQNLLLAFNFRSLIT